MFRNSPEMGGGGIACLGPTTIIGRTIYISESSSGATLDDPWVFAGPITQIDCNYKKYCENIVTFNCIFKLFKLVCYIFLEKIVILT